MKKYLKFWKMGLLMLALVTVSTACSDDDDDKVTPPGQEQVDPSVPRAVVASFEQEFPKATNVRWKQKDGYYVASFSLPAVGRSDDRRPNQAWFLPNGTWTMSELDLPIQVWEIDATYAPVLAAWKTSTYAQQGFRIDEIEVITRQGSKEPVVKLEIEKGKEEYDLFFTLEGVLVKAVADTDGNDHDDWDGPHTGSLPCPAEILKYVETKYPGAILVDFEQDRDYGTLQYEATILTKMGTFNVEKELIFDEHFTFLRADIEVADSVLVGLLQKLLSPEQKTYLENLTGEKNPAEWDFEIIENEKGLLTVYVEDQNDRMVELVKDFDPSALLEPSNK